MSVFTLSPSWHDRGARVLQQVAGSPAVLGLGLCLGLEAAVLAHFKRMLHGYRLEPKRKQRRKEGKKEAERREERRGGRGREERKWQRQKDRVQLASHSKTRRDKNDARQGQKGDTAPMLLHVEHCRHRTPPPPRHPPLPTHLLLPLSPILVTNHIPELLMN